MLFECLFQKITYTYLADAAFDFGYFGVLGARRQGREGDTVLVAEGVGAVDADDRLLHLEGGHVVLAFVAVHPTPSRVGSRHEVPDQGFRLGTLLVTRDLCSLERKKSEVIFEKFNKT